MWDRLFPGRRSCEACSCLPGLWERGFCGFLRLRSGMGGGLPKVPLAEDWCQRVVWHVPQVSSSSAGAAGEKVSDKALCPIGQASIPESRASMARRASQQRHLWGHSERGWGTRGDGAEHRTDTPPPPFPTPPIRSQPRTRPASRPSTPPLHLSEGLVRGSRPPVGGGGLGLNFPGLWRRLWEVEEQRSRCHSGPGPPRLPLQPLREMAFPWGQLSPCGLGLFLPLLASPFF